MAEKTEGYSGADLELLCREAAMKPVRRLMARLVQETDCMALPVTAPTGDKGDRQPGAPAPPLHAHAAPPARGPGGRVLPQSKPSGPTTEEVQKLLLEDPVSYADISSALETTKPSSDGKSIKYVLNVLYVIYIICLLMYAY